MTDLSQHWNRAYEAREETALTWFEDTPETSLALIRAHAPAGLPLIDIGGGASRLVDACLTEGLGPVSVLDLSASALAASRVRLGEKADTVRWIAADATRWTPDRAYGVWHDRAAFHFLTETADQHAYLDVMTRALALGGVAIIATFAEDGPEACSGLPVRRWSSSDLSGAVDAATNGKITPVVSGRHTHVTPNGGAQKFQFSVFRKAR